MAVAKAEAPPAAAAKGEAPAPPAAGKTEAAAPKPSGGLMAWLPAIAAILLAPVATWSMVEFVLLPRLQKKLAATPAADSAVVTNVRAIFCSTASALKAPAIAMSSVKRYQSRHSAASPGSLD